MTVWFTGCQHFDHERIIELARRPFDSVKHMNTTLVERWNERVSHGDTAYILGDVCWNQSPDRGLRYWLDQLNGRKIVVWGNHDRREDSVAPNSDYLEIKIGKQQLVLFHYPIEDWNRRFRGSIHLHAHDHRPEFPNPNIPMVEQSGLGLGPAENYPAAMYCNRFRVGVDACNFRPVSFDEIVEAAYSREYTLT